MSIAVCIAINLTIFCALIFCLQCLTNKFIVIIAIVWLICFNVPIYGWSACDYVYALFDVPSLMLCFLSLWWLIRFLLMRIVVQRTATPCCTMRTDSLLIQMSHFMQSHHFFPPSIQYIWIGLGILVYYGFLGYGFIDIYHLEFKIQLYFLCILSLFSYSLCALAGYGLLLSILGYELQILGQMSIINYCIDPFLWIGCIIALIWRVIQTLIRLYFGGRNGKKVV